VVAPRGNSARGDRRRRQILEAALAVIREEAVADVQLAAIAARAGVRPSHVLNYFGSRDEVLIAAVAPAGAAAHAAASMRSEVAGLERARR
jgi:AcrR family transcriptional regulator